VEETPHRDYARAATSEGISNSVIYHMVLAQTPNLGTSRVLDHGCGRGDFFRILRSRFPAIDLHGVDILSFDQELRSIGTFKQHNLNLAPLPYDDEMFDTIFTIEVIEHLENPRLTVRELGRCLKRGGHLYLTTPVNRSLRGLISLLVRGHYWAFSDRSYPAHITALLEIDIARIADEAGLKLEAIYYSNYGGIPGMPHRSWQSIFGRFARGPLFSDNLLAVIRKPA
jgi:2-polyprenyl-3-methyl-5-hydroxy-6-metoxy-1,4-benzoquinol methylase